MKKKILIFGNFHNGNLAFELFQNLNNKHDFKTYDFNRLMIIEPFKSKYLNFIFRLSFSKVSQLFLNFFLFIKIQLIKPQYFIAIKGLNIFPLTLKLFPKYVKKINWNLDDFENFKNSNENLIKTIKYYDIIISPKKELFKSYEKLGAKKILFIENFYLKRYHKYFKTKKIYKISFVGSWSNKREKYINSIIEFYQVHVFGNSWTKIKKHNNLKCHEYVDQNQYSKIINQSEICLNFFTEENNDTSNLRLFEVPACKGILLSEFSKRASEILTPNKEAFFFKNENELIEKINLILNIKKMELENIRVNGFKKIKSFDLNFRIEEVLNEII